MCVLLVMFKRITYLPGQKLTSQKWFCSTKSECCHAAVEGLIVKQIQSPDDCWAELCITNLKSAACRHHNGN